MTIIIVVVLAVAFVVLAGTSSLVIATRRRRLSRADRAGVLPSPAPHEAGPHEAGPHEAGPHEAGPHEAGPHEAGPAVVALPGQGDHGLQVVEPEVVEAEVVEPEVVEPEVVEPEVVEAEPTGPEVLERPRFRDRLGKARSLLAEHLVGLRGRSKLDEQAWDELEDALILADVGVVTVGALLADLRQRARDGGLTSPEQLVAALREELVRRLEGDVELHRAAPDMTTVWLFVGVNGVGKTTTIGKLAMREQAEGRRVVMAAGDTFRAAAADQLALWSERAGSGFVRGNEGGDPGAVVFDAVQHATARAVPLVLADTAGRLHTKVNLMEELKKVRRVADRPPGSVSEVLLVIDATTGQNGLVQARQFAEAVGVTGVVLTKLDGTAKGGIAVAIAGELGIPIKLVGLGEGPEDLVAFNARELVDALLPAD